MEFFKNLPDEMLMEILDHLDPISKLQLRRVCKKWDNFLRRPGMFSVVILKEGELERFLDGSRTVEEVSDFDKSYLLYGLHKSEILAEVKHLVVIGGYDPSGMDPERLTSEHQPYGYSTLCEHLKYLEPERRVLMGMGAEQLGPIPAAVPQLPEVNLQPAELVPMEEPQHGIGGFVADLPAPDLPVNGQQALGIQIFQLKDISLPAPMLQSITIRNGIFDIERFPKTLSCRLEMENTSIVCDMGSLKMFPAEFVISKATVDLSGQVGTLGELLGERGPDAANWGPSNCCPVELAVLIKSLCNPLSDDQLGELKVRYSTNLKGREGCEVRYAVWHLCNWFFPLYPRGTYAEAVKDFDFKTPDPYSTQILGYYAKPRNCLRVIPDEERVIREAEDSSYPIFQDL